MRHSVSVTGRSDEKSGLSLVRPLARSPRMFGGITEHFLEKAASLGSKTIGLPQHRRPVPPPEGAAIEWPDDQAARRCAECIVQDVDVDDLVLEVLVEVVVPLVVVQVAVLVTARMKALRGHLSKMTFEQSASEAVTQCSHFEPVSA